jgi:hypothetical protein
MLESSSTAQRSPYDPSSQSSASSQGKKKDESIDDYDKRMRVVDSSLFVRELWKKYPNARLVLANKSPAEKAAIEMAELLEMPVEVIEQAPSDAWDAGVELLDERIVARSTHVVTVDDSGDVRSTTRKLAAKKDCCATS